MGVRGHGDAEGVESGAERPSRRQLTSEQAARVQRFLDEHGEAAFNLALRTGALYGDLRAVSEFSINTAMQAYDAGLPSNLLLQMRPRAPKKGERVEARVVMGETTQLVLDFSAVG